MARKFKDTDCIVVEKKFTPAKEEKKYIFDGQERVIPAQEEKHVVKILGGVGYSAEMGYEDSYLKSVAVSKEKYDMTKVGEKVVCTYDYSTDKDGKDNLRNFDYEFVKK